MKQFCVVVFILILAGCSARQEDYFFGGKTYSELCIRNGSGPWGAPVEINQTPDVCYLRLARSYNSSEACFKINSSQMRDKCLWAVAVDLSDKSLCDKIQGPHPGCYYEIAFKNKESGACEMLPDKSKKEMCYYRYGADLADASYCPKSGSSEIACYSQVALKLRDSSVCGRITDPGSRESCRKRVAE